MLLIEILCCENIIFIDRFWSLKLLLDKWSLCLGSSLKLHLLLLLLLNLLTLILLIAKICIKHITRLLKSRLLNNIILLLKYLGRKIIHRLGLLKELILLLILEIISCRSFCHKSDFSLLTLHL